MLSPLTLSGSLFFKIYCVVSLKFLEILSIVFYFLDLLRQGLDLTTFLTLFVHSLLKLQEFFAMC